MGKYNRLLAVLCTTTAMVASAPAFAQEAEEDKGGIAEIVVTAQKRAENVQDVPIAISAFAGDAMEERAVGDISALAALSPNVSLDSNVPFSGSTAVLAASIRGIGSNDFAFNIDPGVGVYIDGVYLARSVGANQDLLDIERIEVLKGPQGTLFGRNTIGGAVSVVTQAPAKELSGRGDLTIGSYNLMQARGTINLPISSNLFSSASFVIKSRDGYGKRIAFPDADLINAIPHTTYPSVGYSAPRREGDEQNATVRAKLMYDDGGPFRFIVVGDYQRNKSSAPNTLLATVSGTNPNFGDLYNLCVSAPAAVVTGAGLNNLCSSFGTQYSSNRRGEITSITRFFGLGGTNTDANPNNDRLLWGNQFITGDPDVSYANGNNFSELTNWGVTATAEMDLSDSMSLKSITGYREGHWLSGQDLDGSPINMLHASFDQDQWQFSEELQLTGDAMDGDLNYVLGAYYFKEKGSLLDLVTFAEGMNQIDGPNWLETQNYAAYGQVDWRVNDLIGITLGARYTHEDKSFEGGQQEMNGLFYKLMGSAAFAGTPLFDPALTNICADTAGNIYPNAVLPGFGGATCAQVLGYPSASNPLRVYPEGINKAKFNNFSPKVGIQLHPAEDVMVYGSWSKGYKTGGWTTRYTSPQLTAAGYNPEKASTFEIGLKSTLLDRRLQVNLAGFTTKYTDIQLNYQVGTSPTIANVGDARIKGFEIEVVAAPIDVLTINASVGYLDSYYTRLDPAVAVASGAAPFQAGAIVGGPLPKSPKWKFNISPRVEIPVGENSIVLLADWSHTSSQWNNVERTFALKRPSNDMVNASIAFKPASDDYSLTLGVTNLTDDRQVVGGSSIPASGVISGVYNRPREWYFRLGFEF